MASRMFFASLRTAAAQRHEGNRVRPRPTVSTAWHSRQSEPRRPQAANPDAPGTRSDPENTDIPRKPHKIDGIAPCFYAIARARRALSSLIHER